MAPLLLALLVSCGLYVDTSAESVDVILGPQETTFSDGYQGMRYFPDEPIVVIRTNPWVWFMVVTNRTVLMQGRTLETSLPVRVVLAPGGAGDFDADYAGISGFYDHRQRREMLALYHAEKLFRDGQPEERKYDWAIGLAVSKDGRAFNKMGAVITSSTPRTNPVKAHHGVGDPSLCPDASGRWLFCYYTDLSQLDGRPHTICMARCDVADAARPGKWHKYYNGAFSQAALGGKDSPVVPRPVIRSDIAHPNVQYVASLRKYVMTLFALAHEEFNSTKQPKISGFYLSLSVDGITWSPPQQLFASHVLPITGQEVALRPYLHIERSTADVMDGTLIYSYSQSWGPASPHTPHHMVKRSIRLKLSESLKDEE